MAQIDHISYPPECMPDPLTTKGACPSINDVLDGLDVALSGLEAIDASESDAPPLENVIDAVKLLKKALTQIRG